MEPLRRRKELSRCLGAGKIVAGVGAGAAEVADRLVEGRGNAHHGEIAVAEGLGDEDGVAPVGLDLLIGLAFAPGRRHDDALEPEAEETPGEDKTGGAGLVADFQVAEGDRELGGETPQAAFRGQDAAAAFAEVGGSLRSPALVKATAMESLCTSSPL